MGGSHPRGGGEIVWACAEDNLIEEKEDNKEIGLQRFNYTLIEEKDGRGGSRGY